MPALSAGKYIVDMNQIAAEILPPNVLASIIQGRVPCKICGDTHEATEEDNDLKKCASHKALSIYDTYSEERKIPVNILTMVGPFTPFTLSPELMESIFGDYYSNFFLIEVNPPSPVTRVALGVDKIEEVIKKTEEEILRQIGEHHERLNRIASETIEDIAEKNGVNTIYDPNISLDMSVAHLIFSLLFKSDAQVESVIVPALESNEKKLMELVDYMREHGYLKAFFGPKVNEDLEPPNDVPVLYYKIKVKTSEGEKNIIVLGEDLGQIASYLIPELRPVWFNHAYTPDSIIYGFPKREEGTILLVHSYQVPGEMMNIHTHYVLFDLRNKSFRFLSEDEAEEYVKEVVERTLENMGIQVERDRGGRKSKAKVSKGETKIKVN